MQELRSRA